MRDLALILATLTYVPLAFLNPGAGAACWVWYSIMSPHEQVYGLAHQLAFNSLVAVAALLTWLLSAERKTWTADGMPWVVLVFAGWMTVNSFFAPFFDYSWTYWDRTMHMLVMAYLLFFVANTKARIHGTIWALVLAIGYYGVKGGMFTIVTGGDFLVVGPPGSIIGDNNQLAAAVVMVLPLVNYLRMHSRNRFMQIGLVFAIILMVFMVLGTHSRGGLIALSASLFVLWLTNRHKLGYGIAGLVIMGPALYFMPSSFWYRMDTLKDVSADGSFEGRVQAWHVAFHQAVARFPFGAGFYAPQLPVIWDQYYPDYSPHAAHSIYFQVLGEHGFIGLGLYLIILLLALYNIGVTLRLTRGRADFVWAHDLAKMMRVALIGFFVGGAALSMAYFDGLFVLIVLSSCLRDLAQRQTVPGGAPTPGRLRHATRLAARPARGVAAAERAGHPPAIPSR